MHGLCLSEVHDLIRKAESLYTTSIHHLLTTTPFLPVVEMSLLNDLDLKTRS